MLDEEAVTFKKTVFDWEAQLLERAELDEKAVVFKKTLLDWEAELLK